MGLLAQAVSRRLTRKTTKNFLIMELMAIFCSNLMKTDYTGLLPELPTESELFADLLAELFAERVKVTMPKYRLCDITMRTNTK
jgi:hypothetical protein